MNLLAGRLFGTSTSSTSVVRTSDIPFIQEPRPLEYELLTGDRLAESTQLSDVMCWLKHPCAVLPSESPVGGYYDSRPIKSADILRLTRRLSFQP